MRDQAGQPRTSSAPWAIIVYGPQGTGKTLNAKRMRKRFDCQRIIEEWMRDPVPKRALIITNESVNAVQAAIDAARRQGKRVEAVPVSEARTRLGKDWIAVPRLP